MPIDVSAALDSDTAEFVTVTRFAVGAYVDGIYEKGATSTFKAVCSVQQPSADEVQLLPEGERDKDIRKFISKKELKTTNDRNNEIADLVLYKGNQYKIISAQDWNVYGHTTAFGARIQ